MNTFVTDTHALLWHLAKDPALSTPAASLFRQADTGGVEILIPSVALVEVVYLCERQRVPGDRIDHILSLPHTPGSRYRVIPLDESVVQALRHPPRPSARYARSYHWCDGALSRIASDYPR